MAIQNCGIDVDTDRHELRIRGTPMFPCGGYCDDINDNMTDGIPWHWHEEIEVIAVPRGTMRMNLNEAEFTLKEGEGAFINSNVLHSIQAADGEGCALNSLVLDAGIIAGAVESVFEQRYVRPLSSCGALMGIIFYRDIEWQRQAVQCIQEAYDAYRAEEFGYELIVREKLSRMWYLMVLNNRDLLTRQNMDESQDVLRTKIMLDFLHNCYSEPIDLRRIAAAANIGERECLRCFRKTVGMPPMRYLMKHRVSVSARLLAETGVPVTEICGLAGFESPSYFSKIFKRFMGCTPTIYRKTSSAR